MNTSFQNTVTELEKCYKALKDQDQLKQYLEDEYENPFVHSLISMCVDIAEEFGEAENE